MSLRVRVRLRLLDLIPVAISCSIVLLLLLVFTPLGDPLAAAGRRSLSRPLLPLSSTSRSAFISSIDGDDLSSSASADRTAEIAPCPSGEVDSMPCEDPRRSRQYSRVMNFYRERHCPLPEEKEEFCLVPPPDRYRVPIQWPESLHKIWHENMPYNKIAERKGHQGWMKKEGPYFIFPGGGTMFPDGAVQYIQKLGQYIPINKGILRTALDMGCGVASFGGYLLHENILTFSFAPRDSHKSQIQFALERGIPAFVAMLGTRRLPFPANSFDLVHCSRCLIPFTSYNGSYIIEVDRLLRPGGYLIISGPPVRWPKQEKEWAELQAAAHALCFKLIVVEGNTVIWKKPSDTSCFPNQNKLGFDLCTDSDDPSSAWYHKLETCVSKLSFMQDLAIGSIPKWPERLSKPPARLSLVDDGLNVFEADTQHWAKRVAYYKNSLGLELGTNLIRNVMDMNAFLGGFAAALISHPVWVMNVIPAHKSLTLDVIYDRGLIGVYHDWCEAFSTYPRTYDFIHVAGIDSLITDSSSSRSRCHLVDVIVEMDRILRPEGTALIRDSPEIIDKVARIATAVRWKVKVHKTEPGLPGEEKILVATKTLWKLSSPSR